MSNVSYRTILFLSIILLTTHFSYAQNGKKIKMSEFGTASYYAKKFNGRKTANGEKFSNDSLTAAHHSLPFGTLVKVKNIKTNDSITVRINDRIAHRKRIIDLSYQGAKQLNFLKSGTAKVKLEVLNLSGTNLSPDTTLLKRH